MKIRKNVFNRFDIDGIQDRGVKNGNNLITKGISGYHGRLGNIIGWVLSYIFHKTVFLKGDEGTYYLDCKSLKDWFNRVNIDNIELKALDKNIHNPKWVAHSIDSVRAAIRQSLSILNIKDEEKVGRFRRNVDEKKPPDLIACNSCIETTMLYSAAFAVCFHTTESHEEIWNLIEQTRIKDHGKEHKKKFPALSFEPLNFYAESYAKLYNSLVDLHNELPGESKEKRVKIYWNQAAEEILFPHFFHNESVKINDLVFAVVGGETGSSPFQAQNIDFTQQLQFIGIGKEKIMRDLNNEVERLSEEILGRNILSSLNIKVHPDNGLFAGAFTFTSLNYLRINLQNMRNENKKIHLDKMEPESIRKILADFMTAPLSDA